MSAWAVSYLELVADGHVAAAVLDAHAAFVVSGDGGRILLANPGGMRLLGADGRQPSPTPALRAQFTRLAKTLPARAARLEMVRLGLAAMPFQCRAIGGPGRDRAVLAIAAAAAPPEPLGVRAAALVASLEAAGIGAAVLDAHGATLAASAAFDPDEPADEAPLVADGLNLRLRLARAGPPAAAPSPRPSGAEKPERQGEPEAPAAVDEPATPAADRERPEPEEATPPATEATPPAATTAATAATRFTWTMAGDGAFAAISPELAAAVGEANAAVVGRTWAEVAGPLALDPGGLVAAHLAGGGPWSARVYWPIAGAGERMAVDLTAMPAGEGLRGFGILRTDERKPDPPPAEGQAAEAETGAGPGPPRAAAADHGAADADAPAKVVRLGRTAADRLSGSEADAFRRIADLLARAREAGWMGAAETEATPTGEAPAPAPPFDLKLLDRLPLGLAIFRDRRTLFVNRALLDALDYDDAEAFAAAGGVETLFAEPASGWSEQAPPRELAARRSDGSTLAVNARLNTVQWLGESALMLTIVPRAPAVADGGEQTEKRIATERRIGDLQAILNTATDGVIVFDRTGRVESMNRAAEALFAVTSADFTGRSFTELLADESHKAALDYLDGLAANGVASVLNDGREVIGRVPHGGLIPLFMTMGRMGDNRFCAVVRDITHWKNIEEELVAARRSAEAANLQKSEFLAKVSHEIRTPLNAIIGFSEIMMEQRFGPIGNDRYRAYLHDIHVSGAHLMSLINDLLDLSKIEAGKVDLTFESVPVNSLIQECVALMQPLANRERIIIRTSLATQLPNVVADMRSLRQILLNLLSNAIKFTQAGGQVIVSTVLETSGEIVVRIRDTGIGMTAKDVETAMQPFRQIASAQGDRDKGTGLGLPLTKAMVEANRAAFAIESAPNQGTLVRITFPTTRVLAG
jgi:PAS domain S-box-containing protein